MSCAKCVAQVGCGPCMILYILYESCCCFRVCLVAGKHLHYPPVVQARPQLQRPQDWSKMVPIAIHGDGVSYMQRAAGGKALDVLSWASLLSRQPTKASSFLMFLIVKSIVKESGVGQTWAKAWRVLIWSLDALAAGTWPMLDWNNQPFPEDSIDFQRRGSPLAGGYSAFLFVVRADLEFLANHFGLSSPSSNNLCALCQANRDPSVTLYFEGLPLVLTSSSPIWCTSNI